VAFIQGILRVESTESPFQFYIQFIKNSSMRVTSVSLVILAINILVHLVLIMYGTRTSYHYRLCINITVCHETGWRLRRPANSSLQEPSLA